MIGAAVGLGIYQVTKKRADGSSILSDLTENAPDWFEKGKQFATQTIDQVTDTIKANRPGNQQ